MKKLLTRFTLALSLLAPLAQAAADDPVSQVRDTSRQALELINKNGSKARNDVEALVVPKFDFTRMTALAVGRGWRDASPQQQSALTQQFQTLLVRTYANTMTRFKNAKIDVKPTALLANDGREATVKSEVLLPSSGDNKPVSVDYVFYKGNAGWKVYNVQVEGASLVTVYRNQFNDEIRKNGVDGLIQLLRTKNGAKGA